MLNIEELGLFLAGDRSIPASPQALKMLNDLKKDHPVLESKHVLISGYSPERHVLIELLLRENATVTVSCKEGISSSPVKLEVIS